jgi:hypothetical protein
MASSTLLTDRIIALPRWEIPSYTAPNGERTYQTPLGIGSSVTTILSGSRDNSDLELWRESFGVKKADEIRDFAAARGTSHHALIEQFLTDHMEPEFDYVQTPYWRSIRAFLGTIQHSLVLEGAIWHPEGFAGSFDWLGYLEDDELQPTLCDWKTADTPRNPKKMYEYKLQAAAYVAGANYVYASLGLDIQRAKIVVALPDQPPQIETLDKSSLDQLFQHFLARLQRYTFAKK